MFISPQIWPFLFRNMIQSLESGDGSMCPVPGKCSAKWIPMELFNQIHQTWPKCPSPLHICFCVAVYLGLTNHAFSPGDTVYLPCQSDSNLAQVHWHFSGQPLQPSAKHLVHNSGVYILDATKANAGIYTCEAVEEVKGRLYSRTLAAYHLKTKSSLCLIYQVAVVALSVVLLVWSVHTFSGPSWAWWRPRCGPHSAGSSPVSDNNCDRDNRNNQCGCH